MIFMPSTRSAASYEKIVSYKKIVAGGIFMPGIRTRPQDQEMLAGVIQALRAAAGGEVNTEFQEEALRSYLAAGGNPTIAGTLVSNFDRLTPSRRRQALGDFASAPVFETGYDRRAARTAIGSRNRGTFSRSTIRFPRERRHPIDPTEGQAIDPTDGQVLVGDHHTGNALRFYAIDYRGFHCNKLAGDAVGSDEFYAISSAASIRADGTNQVRTQKHPIDQVEYGDVDLAETRLGPVARCFQGRETPISLTVVAFERDFGDPNHYRDEVDNLVKAAIAAAAAYYGADATAVQILGALSGTIGDAINWVLDTDDDQVDIARTTILEVATIEELGRRGRRAYISHIHYDFPPIDMTVTTPLACHFFSEHSGLGGRYVFGFDLVRDPAFVEDEIIVE
jgi:hypothetical protein